MAPEPGHWLTVHREVASYWLELCVRQPQYSHVDDSINTRRLIHLNSLIPHPASCTILKYEQSIPNSPSPDGGGSEAVLFLLAGLLPGVPAAEVRGTGGRAGLALDAEDAEAAGVSALPAAAAARAPLDADR